GPPRRSPGCGGAAGWSSPPTPATATAPRPAPPWPPWHRSPRLPGPGGGTRDRPALAAARREHRPVAVAAAARGDAPPAGPRHDRPGPARVGAAYRAARRVEEPWLS